MTIQQLKYVIKVAECGSISEASKQLFISQPSLSSAIKELESEYGIEIFNRTTKGISLSSDGTEFLSYARQVIEQTQLMERRYKDKKQQKQLCSVSTQHYAFAVNAFVKLISALNTDEYEFTLRETRTYEIIDDVANFRSELGIIYLSNFNQKVIQKLIKDNNLLFKPLFIAEPHVFLSTKHPLAGKAIIQPEELDDYPFLTFEQGTYNSFYFSEEMFVKETHKKVIHVSDRATLFNLLIGLNGYTICSGVLNSNLNGNNISSVRLNTAEKMTVGFIQNKKIKLSNMSLEYIEHLKELIKADGFEIL
ncbi:MAG: LysR family transcriptional regulator [Acutalibacteraceae bacterium]|nr:LysR family transcriptional regulator [Acutalibacteraceae bacterium]